MMGVQFQYWRSLPPPKQRLVCVMVALLLLFPMYVSPQITYQRACECERTEGGKCAYTVVRDLPPQTCLGDDSTKGQCTDAMEQIAGFNSSIEDISHTIERIARNVTEQAAKGSGRDDSLRILETRLEELQQAVSDLQEHTLGTNVGSSDYYANNTSMDSDDNADNGKNNANENNNDNKNNDNNNNNNNSSSNTKSIVAQLTEQKRAIVALQSELLLYKNTTSVLTQLSRDIADLRSRNTDQTQQILELNSDLTDLADRVRSLAGRAGLCEKRGMLVSGRDGYIDDAGISVSSAANGSHGAVGVRIQGARAWCAGGGEGGAEELEGSGEVEGEPNADYEYVEFDLGSARQVFGVVTRGRADYEQWVTRYKLQYRMEGGEAPWSRYEDAVGLEMVFPGNTDKDTPVMNMLWQPIRTRYVRIVPLQGFRNICMRADVIGCVDADNNNES